jgi:DNA-binding CsgD family transcriptional regulator
VDSAPAWPEEISALRSLDRHAEADVLLRRTPALPPSLRYARAQLDLDAWHLIEAEEQARELVDLGLRSGPTTHTRDAALLLAAVALIRGEASTAAHLLRRTADAPETEEVVTLRGWLALLIGDLPAARIAGRTLLALAETGARWSWRPEWVTLLAEIGGNAGDPGLVELAAVRAAEGARRVPGTVTWAGLARYLRGQVDQDLTMIADGVALLREGPRALLRSWAADGYGHALLAAGDRRRAIGQLDTAWEEYHQAGARAGRSRVQRAMREAGVRSKKWRTATERQATGWSALSEAERRVAALIAAGSTNKMAAAELGISINTVGTHLRSVYAKMAVQSRVQLANLLRDHLPA